MVVFQRFLFACILYLRAYSASGNNWDATIPKSVVGLSGSCVVIPCTYNYPSNGKTYTDFTGIWYKGDSDIIYHTDTSKIISKFKDRTSLLGNLQQKNCTLKMNSLQHDDEGEYMFRIEIKDLDMYSYKESKVSITVKDSPELPSISVEEEVTSQKEVTATCVVSHSCLSDPPRLTWSHKGTTTSDSKPKEDGQLKFTSSLTFTPSREDHNKPLSCSAVFTPAKTVSINKNLKVKYPPEIKSGSSCESETFIVCVCIVDSNPPSEVKWLGPSSSFPSSSVEQNGSLTIFTLQGWLGFPDTVHCSASNSQGNSVMTLSVPHHGLIIYLVVAAVVVVVIVVVISACVAKRRCGRRPARSVLDVKNDHNELKTTPKSDKSSQERKNVDLYTKYEEIDQPVYKNFECDDGNPSCEQDEDDAVYANT